MKKSSQDSLTLCALVACTVAMALGSAVGIVVVTQLSRIEERIAAAEALQRQVAEELAARKVWMDSQTEWRKKIESMTDDRFRRSEFNRWAEKHGLEASDGPRANTHQNEVPTGSVVHPAEDTGGHAQDSGPTRGVGADDRTAKHPQAEEN